jgi:hypothetical protein
MDMYNLTLVSFANMVNDFFDYMGRDKWPPNGRVAAWYEKLKSQQEGDVIKAFNFMKDNLDSLPHNIPKAVKSAIFIINREKPVDKSIKHAAYGQCHDCHGTGAFKLRVCAPEGYWYEPIKYCGSCENYRLWTNSPGERATAADLDALGILWKPHNKVLRRTRFQGGSGTVADVQSLAAGLSAKMTM